MQVLSSLPPACSLRDEELTTVDRLRAGWAAHLETSGWLDFKP